MLRRSSNLLVRLPAIRRPRERPWEYINKREFGLTEGGQNFQLYFFFVAFTSLIIGIEFYREFNNILLRGDTCAACDEARRVYRQKQMAKERELAEIEHIRASKAPKM